MGAFSSRAEAPPAAPTPYELPPVVSLTTDAAGRVQIAPEAVWVLLESLRTRGFALLEADDSLGSIGPHLANARRHGLEFFAQPEETKLRHIDPAPANRWYVPGVSREYLKMRRQERPDLWPSRELETAFQGIFDFANAATLDALRRCHATLKAPFLGAQEFDEMAACFGERASVGLVHYYDPVAPETVAAREGAVSAGKAVEFEDLGDAFCVCATHTDTGIFTLIFVNPAPGLDIVDQSTGVFEKVEAMAAATCPQGRTRAVLIQGEKAPLFLGDRLQPTKHRVTVRAGVVRESILFFQDTVDSENRYPEGRAAGHE
eukprot:Amastigsp_a174643_319.p1 type:complete len:318 gc:universal Amastigsp_a174643_319:966-13(-)